MRDSWLFLRSKSAHYRTRRRLNFCRQSRLGQLLCTRKRITFKWPRYSRQPQQLTVPDKHALIQCVSSTKLKYKLQDTHSSRFAGSAPSLLQRSSSHTKESVDAASQVVKLPATCCKDRNVGVTETLHSRTCVSTISPRAPISQADSEVLSDQQSNEGSKTQAVDIFVADTKNYCHQLCNPRHRGVVVGVSLEAVDKEEEKHAQLREAVGSGQLARVRELLQQVSADFAQSLETKNC